MKVDLAWQRIDYDPAWERFDALFAFHPSMNPADWPAISEPPGSVTIDLGPIFDHDGPRFVAGQTAVNALAFTALTRVVPVDKRLTVLDWQHQTYSFWPHRALAPPDEWPVPPFPNGDYFIFLSEDMTAGTFGHPWERSLCIFGTPLVNALAPMLSSWLPLLRDARAQQSS